MTSEKDESLLKDSRWLDLVVTRQTGALNSLPGVIALYNEDGIAQKIVNFYPEKALNLQPEVLTDRREKTRETIEARELLTSYHLKKLSFQLFVRSRVFSHAIAYVKPERSQRGVEFGLHNPIGFYTPIEEDRAIEIDGNVYPVGYFFVARSGVSKFNLNGDLYDASILENLIEPCSWYAEQQRLMPAILKKASMLALGVRGLGQRLKTLKEQGVYEVEQRLGSFDRQRSFNRTVAYDLENEDIQNIDLSIENIDKPIRETANYIAANCDVPQSEIFNFLGLSSGLSSTVANSELQRIQTATKVQEWATTHLVPWYQFLLELNGYQGLRVEIPLSIPLTLTERAKISNTLAQRNKTLLESGQITVDEAHQTWRGFNPTPELNLDSFVRDARVTRNSKIEEMTEVSSEDFDTLSEELLETDGFSGVQE